MLKVVLGKPSPQATVTDHGPPSRSEKPPKANSLEVPSTASWSAGAVIVGGVLMVPTLKWAMAVLQFAKVDVTAGSAAHSLTAQKLPSESTLMPLRSPSRPPTSFATPALTSTGVSIVPAASLARRPVTYIDMNWFDPVPD